MQLVHTKWRVRRVRNIRGADFCESAQVRWWGEEKGLVGSEKKRTGCAGVGGSWESVGVSVG